MFFSFSSPAKRTFNANNTAHYAKLGKNGRDDSKRNYSITTITTAIIIAQKKSKKNLILKERQKQFSPILKKRASSFGQKRTCFIIQSHFSNHEIREELYHDASPCSYLIMNSVVIMMTHTTTQCDTLENCVCHKTSPCHGWAARL